MDRSHPRRNADHGEQSVPDNGLSKYTNCKTDSERLIMAQSSSLLPVAPRPRRMSDRRPTISAGNYIRIPRLWVIYDPSVLGPLAQCTEPFNSGCVRPQVMVGSPTYHRRCICVCAAAAAGAKLAFSDLRRLADWPVHSRSGQQLLRLFS